MSYLLELLGKGLETPLMSLVLPVCSPLSAHEVEMLNEAVRDEPNHIANKLRLAIHYAQSGSEQKADAIFDSILSDNPRHADARLARAAMYASVGSLDRAVEHLRENVKYFENDSRVHFGLGYCHERKGELDKALKFYQRATSCKPYLRQATERIASIYLYRNEYRKTIEQCRILQKEHPEDVWIHLVLGQLYVQTKQYSDATVVFEEALTVDPDNFDGHDDEVESLAKAGQIDQAIELMQHVICQEQGDFPDSYVRLADLFSQTGDDASAVMNYKRAIGLHPGFLEAAVKLGTQHMRMQRNYEAAVMFNNAIEINDRIISAYVGLGVAQKCCDLPEQAQDSFELAAALEPNTNLLFAEMNRLQMKVSLDQQQPEVFGDTVLLDNSESDGPDDLLDKQIERYRCAIEEKPNQADLLYSYALLLRGRGQTEQAIEYLQKALSINTAFQKARIKLGLALREIAKDVDAQKQFFTAMVLDEENRDLHYKLGMMYCDRIEFALAVEHFESEGKSEFGSNAQANLTLALQNMGLIDRAAAAWKSVCELDPQSTLAFQAQRSIVNLNRYLT